MNNKIIKIVISLLCSAPLVAQPSTLALKEEIRELSKKNTESGEKNSALLLELAKKYQLDQDQEHAFVYFLKAINVAAGVDIPYLDEDNRIYSEALAVYLDPHAQSTRETAATILKNYGQLAKDHPEYIQIGFLVAASNANQGHYNDFFDLFYRSYLAAPNHYLAYKTKSIIHIKLFERASTLAEKDKQRESILHELSKSIELYPQDHTLYKMSVGFAPHEQKAAIISRSLKKIIDGNIVIPRTDIGFYVEESAKAGLYDEAQQLLNKAREWYQFSRIINTAQEFLDQQRKRG